MKLIIPIACFAACLAFTYAKRCETEDDCDDGQCCVALTTSQMMKKGLCLKLSRAGRKCNAPEAKVDYYGGKYLRYCPCQDGLACEPRRKRVRTIGATPVMICQKPAATTAKPEETEAPEEVTSETIPEIVEETTIPEIVEETTIPEIVEETTIPEIVEETTIPEIVEETTIPEIVEETTAPDETGDETGDEGTGDETGNETGDEGTGDETGNEETGDEIPDEGADELEGPGGEPPRDDDCEDWELPC